MAEKLISLSNLSTYDGLIKTYVGNADAKAIKTVLVDGDNIKFYKKENATKEDTPDYTVAIASSDVEDIKATLTGYSKTSTVAAGVAAAEAEAKAYTDAEIKKLDKDDAAVTGQFVTAVVEADGVITVSRASLGASDIPTLTVDKLSDAGTAAKSDVATTAIAEDTTDTSLVSAAQVAKFVQDEVADLEGATHFRGTFDKLEDVTDPKNGDIAIVGVKEYIYVKPDEETAGAWKELGDESIYVTKTTKIAGVDLENDITKDELLTALNVADGAQVNVLEGVQVNGTDLTATDKKVNVTVATGATDGSLAVNGTDVAVKGLKSGAFTDIADLDATVTNVTTEVTNPTIAVSVTETDGKLTAVSASAEIATTDEINGLFE